MFDIDKWNEIYSTIKKHKLRTFLTALGVAWGIFMLIVLLGAGKGLENGILNSFGVAKNTVFIWSQRTSKEYMGLKAGRFLTFTNDDVQALRQRIPEIDVIAPQNNLQGNFTVNRGTKAASFNVTGQLPEFYKVRPMIITEGRFINEIDIREQRKVVAIGTEVQKVLFGDENPMGKNIIVKGVSFTVVGLIKSKARGEAAMEEAQAIYMPGTTLQYAYNRVNKVDFFAFTPKDGIPAAVIEEKVKQLLAERHHVHPEDVRAFGSANVEKEYENLKGLFLGIASFSWLVSVGTILAGIIGVSNIMLIVVRERTKEIGIRKALGATPFSIVSLIIQEAIVITSVAGYAGLAVGIGLVETINFLMKKFEIDAGFFASPEVDMSVALTAVGLLIFAGAFAGLIPATKAAAVNPIVALRDE